MRHIAVIQGALLRVVAVVVTYSRRELLGRALAALAAQTRPPDVVVVVDNASPDGTAAFVRERHPECDLTVLTRNTGGAGGFAAGLARALALDAEAVWLMDDDTEPAPDALAELLRAYDSTGAALVASRVLWTDGRDHPMNTPRVKRRDRGAENGRIRSASFVSILVSAAAVESAGLPVAAYFLWNDDFEYTTRLLRGRMGVRSLTSVAVHRTAAFDPDPGPRFFYEVRNKVWVFTRSRGLAPLEKALYAGSTALRWIRTVAASRRRALLLGCLVRGLWAGLRHGPRPTSALLAEAGFPLPPHRASAARSRP